MSYYLKDPSARRDYGWTWTLEQDDRITASQWLDVDGLTLTESTHDDTRTTIWVAGGVVGKEYDVTNRVTTEQGRVDEKSFRLRIVET